LKFFRSSFRAVVPLSAICILVFAAVLVIPAVGELPTWIRNTEAGTKIESALFRLMELPGGSVLFRRPPHETREALGELLKTQPQEASLYYLRARENEQQLDFPAAEADWKRYVEHSPNGLAKITAQLDLADFHHRRLRPQDEIQMLSQVASVPADASERLTAPHQQRSWSAFERIFEIIRAQGLTQNVSIIQYHAWIARYPNDRSLFVRFLDFLIAQKEYAAANQLVADYHTRFPEDEVFPIKAKALLEYQQGSLQEGLAVYEHTFQPLWDPELVKSYFDLLTQTRGLRKYLDEARAKLNANPENLDATARVFYYYQQQGKLDVAQQTITDFRLHKEASKSEWTAQELFVCARLLEEIHAYAEAARFYYGLYNSKGMSDAQERALAGLISLLLTAPEMPIRLGSGEISMYRDIATLDQGPGFLNGILSLILNTSAPSNQFSEEEQRAVPYFHRARAAELLSMLDTRFPQASRRAELHAQLLEFYAGSGESNAVIHDGRDFLANFPAASERTSVALLMADAYARNAKPDEEFAIYDSVLQELSSSADKVPLGVHADPTGEDRSRNSADTVSTPEDESDEGDGDSGGTPPENPSKPKASARAFQVASIPVATQTGARSPEYARILERYLARLAELKQTRKALQVLRGEIDRNPDDPGLYERFAVFLEQNSLTTEQEEIYRRAIAHFPDQSWYHKLARFYLRHKKSAEFENLTQEVTGAFSGTGLESYFDDVGNQGTPALYLRLNQYANKRFPHNPVFVRNLLTAYRTQQTYDPVAWEALLRQHWFEEHDLRDEFFEFLSNSGKLESEIYTIRQQMPAAGKQQWSDLARENPAAAKFLAEASLWWSNYEDSAPVLKALAEQYPADFETGRAASSVFRSLAYFDPTQTTIAIKIEENLHASDPTSTDILARLGDIYADRELYSKASPYWENIPKVAPGQPDGYLEAATIYWDYFDFDSALRLMGDGRTKLRNPNLYRYEAGAVSENKRDYWHAIEEYVAGALASGADSQAGQRLLQLAARPAHQDLVEKETAELASAPNPPSEAVALRIRILEAQGRKKELEGFLDSVVEHTTSIEQAEEIANIAQQKSLEVVHQHALEKQAALTTDPVARLEIRYALVHFYESRKDLASAQRNIEALYHDNSKILAVVRETVDFYWRQKMRPQAITVLLEAAKAAYPELSKQFSFEAARKATEAGQFQQARELLTPLLKDSPYDAQYLAAMADTYSQAGDDAGLAQFYLETLDLFRNAPLSTDDRKNRIAALRRGLIPALTHRKEYAGAVDQYIELINKFPEDAELTTEAALYALRYQRQSQLLDFYAKTVSQSPNDYRWPMALARMQTSLENYPEAIAMYGKAIAVRPDRTDLRVARAELNERLMHFDDAVADYERLYELAYKDPQWMEHIAETRARQSRNDDAVKALRVALIDGRPENPEKYFEVARRLESWSMVAEARDFAEKGVGTAGPDLLAVSEHQAGVKLYSRVMTRLRQQEKAYAVLRNAESAASSELPVLEKDIAKNGMSAITDVELRRQEQKQRVLTARQGMTAALREIGSTVSNYFTPEEKSSFEKFAETIRTGMQFDDVAEFAIPLAQSAGLGDLEAQLRLGLLMDPAFNQRVHFSQMAEFVGLQRRRLQFAELGAQLESFAQRLDRYHVNAAKSAAADAYAAAGDEVNDLRILRNLNNGRSLDQQTRLFALLLARDPRELVHRASILDSEGDAAAAFTFAHVDAGLAHAIVSGRSLKRDPVWSNAYNALTGLYFSESVPAVNSAFLNALGDSTVGDRLGKPVDRTRALAGSTWFYYGSRYGEYLGTTQQGTPEDFLPAMLEESPATSTNYLALADYYESRGDVTNAIVEIQHTLELTAERADLHDRLAVAYEKQGRPAEALAEWRHVFAILGKQVDTVHVPESFWADFARVCEHIRMRHLFNVLKPDIDSVARAYVRRNGNYRSNVILRSAYLAAGTPETATSWLLDLISAAHDPAIVLADIVEASWMPLDQRAPIYARILEAKRNTALKTDGIEKDYAQQMVRSWEIRWVQHLVRTKQWTQAGEAIAALPIETRDAEIATLVPIELRVAAQNSTLDARIASYRDDPHAAPVAEVLRAASKQLLDLGDKQSARKVLEFVFAREIEEHQMIAANFLGLAEIRLAAGDNPAAVSLLRRLVVAVGSPFENLDPAAALLEKTGHNTEAVEFLEKLVASAPWDSSYRLRLARAALAAAQTADTERASLTTLASNSQSLYSLRTEAALALSRADKTSTPQQLNLGSQELNLLAGQPGAIPSTSADHQFFHEARIRAVGDSKIKISLLRGMLFDDPAQDHARIPLFEVAEAEKSDRFAVCVLEPLLQNQFLRAMVSPVSESTDAEITRSGEERNAQQGEESVPIGGNSLSALSAAQQSQLAKKLGDAMLRLKRAKDALPYLEFAKRQEKTAARRDEIVREIADIRAGLLRDQRNEGRRPILHPELEQDRLVHPRLLAQLPQRARSSAKEGVNR
jgi:cellulose synthase operon protein C